MSFTPVGISTSITVTLEFYHLLFGWSINILPIIINLKATEYECVRFTWMLMDELDNSTETQMVSDTICSLKHIFTF